MMTLTIPLDPELERRLTTTALREGLPPADYALRLIAENLPADREEIKPDIESIRYLEQFERENATDDPEEIARRQKEGEEFMQNLARNRLEMEGPDSRKIWP